MYKESIIEHSQSTSLFIILFCEKLPNSKKAMEQDSSDDETDVTSLFCKVSSDLRCLDLIAVGYLISLSETCIP